MPVKWTLSPFAGAMKRQTSSSPSGVSQPCPSLDGKAIGCLLIRTAELMATFVRVDPQLHRGRFDLRQQLGVQDEEAWKGRTKVVEAVVQDRRPLAADDLVAIDCELSRWNDLRVPTHLLHVFLWRRVP